MERLTEKRNGQNVIPLRQDGKVEWALGSTGTGDAPTQFLYGVHADKLAEYEDLEEQGRMMIVPDIPKNKTLYWIWGDEIMPVAYKRITSCIFGNDGKLHVMCEMITKKDKTFVQTYRRKRTEYTIKKGDKRYFYADDIGKTVFLNKTKAEAALKEVEHE